MKTYKLDKTFAANTDYTAELDKAYIVQKVGTSSTTKGTLKVAGAPCLEIVQDIAPLFPRMTNLNQPLDLGDLYVVIPNSKTFRFEGSAGSEVRLIGKIIELESGEALPAAFAGRYAEQPNKFLSYKSGEVTTAAGGTVAAGAETTIIDFTCPAGEKWLFKHRYQAEGRLDNLDAVPQFYFQIRINDDPLDILSTDMGKKGISGSSTPNPPRDVDTTTTDIVEQYVEKVAATLEDMPIELKPGVNLKVIGVNTGSDYVVPTGQTLSQVCHLVGIKEYI